MANPARLIQKVIPKQERDKLVFPSIKKKNEKPKIHLGGGSGRGQSDARGAFRSIRAIRRQLSIPKKAKKPIGIKSENGYLA